MKWSRRAVALQFAAVFCLAAKCASLPAEKAQVLKAIMKRFAFTG